MMFHRLGNIDKTKCNSDEIPVLIQREYCRDVWLLLHDFEISDKLR